MGGGAWFGGGCDLTPAYLNEADARAFHTFWRQLCAPPSTWPLGQHSCRVHSTAGRPLRSQQTRLQAGLDVGDREQAKCVPAVVLGTRWPDGKAK